LNILTRENDISKRENKTSVLLNIKEGAAFLGALFLVRPWIEERLDEEDYYAYL